MATPHTEPTLDRTRRPRLRVARLAGAAIAVAGLSASALATGPAGASSKGVTVSIASAKVGKILVSGKTLYTLSTGNAACTGQCLKIWPALVLPKGVTRATAGKGVSASKLGTIARAGGTLQVTYGGKALYWFAGDSAAGQVNGNNVTDTWGTWLVVRLSGAASTAAKKTSTPSGGYGY
jgi:predicted lipoprotein with Yx(FWY)xxD motif